MSDLISRQAAIDAIKRIRDDCFPEWTKGAINEITKTTKNDCIEELQHLPSAQQWIQCSDRLPEDNSAVIVTWVNRNPSTYYSEVKDIPFTATAHYDSGKWWWDSCTCQEYLDEYHESPADDVHEDIEMLAWMPFPEPWKGGEE